MKFFKRKNISPLIMLFLGGIILTVGDIFAAEWVRIGGYGLYFTIMLMYLIGMIILVSSYKLEDIAVASTILVLFNVITLTVIGSLWFGEGITLTKIVGLLLGLIAVVLLEMGKKKIFVD